MKQIRIKVDREACQTAAICLQYQLNPNELMYELNDDSIAVIKTKEGATPADAEGWVKLEDVAGYDPQNPEKMRDIALDSAKNCPFNAILVEVDGQIIWPEEL